LNYTKSSSWISPILPYARFLIEFKTFYLYSYNLAPSSCEGLVGLEKSGTVCFPGAIRRYYLKSSSGGLAGLIYSYVISDLFLKGTYPHFTNCLTG